MLGLPKYQSGFVENWEPPHILKKPYESVMFPHSEKVDVSEVIHNPDNCDWESEDIKQVPWGTNVGASISFGHSINSNGFVKKLRGGVKGFQGKDPYMEPPGGVALHITDAKLPQDYYSLTRLRHPDVSIPAVQEVQVGEMITRPQPVLNHQQLMTSITPNVVYDLDLRPALGEWSRPIVYRPVSSVGNFDGVGEVVPNFLQVDKYIQAANMIELMTPIITTYLKIGQDIVPVKFKDPNYIVNQASAALPIDVPLPNGNTVQLKDYSWIIVQNVNSPTELIFELPPQLKDRPDTTTSVGQISAAYTKINHQELSAREANRQAVPVTTPLDQQLFQVYSELATPDLLRPSKIYTAQSNGFEYIPNSDQLQPVAVRMNSQLKRNVVPEPVMNYPWV